MERIHDKFETLIRTGFFHIFGSSVMNKIIAFLSSIVLVRILSKEEYGVFTYAWNIYSIILLFSGMGLDSGMLQLASEKSGDESYAKKISNFSVRFGLLFDLLLMVFILSLALFAPLKIEKARGTLGLLCLLPFFHFLFQMTISYLRAEKKNKEYALVSIINTTLIFLISVGAAVFFREKGLVIGYYVAYLSSFVVAIVVYGVHLFNESTPIEKMQKNILLKISFISMLNIGLSQLMYLLDVFVLGMVDPQEKILASYKVATMLPTALAFIPNSLITYIYPYFAEHREDREWCLTKYRQVLKIMVVFNGCISIALFALAPIVIKMLFGTEYLDAVPVFRLLSINYFVSGTFRILSGNLLVTQRKLKFNLFVAIVSSLTNIIADYFFIGWWGSIGAAVATILVVFVSSVLSTSYLVWILKYKS